MDDLVKRLETIANSQVRQDMDVKILCREAAARINELEGRDALRDRTALEFEASGLTAFRKGCEWGKEAGCNWLEFQKLDNERWFIQDWIAVIRAIPTPEKMS